MDYWKSKVVPRIQKVFGKDGAKKAAAIEACKSFDESKEEISKEFEENKAELQPKVLEIFEASPNEIKILIKELKEDGIRKNSAKVQHFLEQLVKIEFPGSKSVSELTSKYGPGLVPSPVLFVFGKVSTFVVSEEKPRELETAVPEAQAAAPEVEPPTPVGENAAPEVATAAPGVEASVPELQTPELEVRAPAQEIIIPTPEVQAAGPGLEALPAGEEASAPEAKVSAPEVEAAAPEAAPKVITTAEETVKDDTQVEEHKPKEEVASEAEKPAKADFPTEDKTRAEPPKA